MKKLFLCLIAICLMGSISSAQSNIGLEYFSKLDPVKTAEIHNEVLGGIMELQKSNPTLSIRDALLKLKIDLSKEDRLAIYDYISAHNNTEDNYKSVLSMLKSQKAKTIYAKMNEIIDKNSDYNSLVKAINAELTVASNDLKGFDLKAIQVFAETSKASAYYWFTLEQQSYARGNPPKWVKKDGNGIAQASVGWAIGAAFCGGGPLSYAIACGVGGALASVWPD